MSGQLGEAIQAFVQVTQQEFDDTIGPVFKILSNIKENPSEPKFRKIRTTNQKIAGLLRVRGVRALLDSAGFVEEGEFLALPMEAPISSIGAALDALDAACVAGKGSLVLRLTLPSHGNGIRSCCGAADGRAFVTGSMDNMIRVWSADAPLGGGDPEPAAVLAKHESARGVSGVLALKLLPGGEVASAGRDGNIFIWDSSDVAPTTGARAAAPLASLAAHGDAAGKEVSNKQVVTVLAHDGAGTLLSGGWDQTVRVWPARMAGSPLPLEPPSVLEHTQAVLAIAVLSDGRVVSGAGDGKITVWARTGGTFAAVGGCSVNNVVRGLAALADGGFAQVANDGVLRVWTADAQQARASPSVGCYLFCVANLNELDKTAAPLRIATGGDDGVVRIWVAEGPGGLVAAQEIRTPAETYAMALLPNGELLCASDEAGAYVFTRQPSRAAPAAAQKQLLAAAQAFATPQPSSAPAQPAQAPVGGGGGGGGGGANVVNGVQYDFVYPVQMGGGESKIYWNRGDDPEVVAAQFALRNGVGMDELQDIKNFIHTAMGSGGGGGGGGGMGGGGGSVPAAQQSAALAQIVSMGFDAGQAQAVLERAGWNVEAALAMLLG